jgi:hypothetical protein
MTRPYILTMSSCPLHFLTQLALLSSSQDAAKIMYMKYFTKGKYESSINPKIRKQAQLEGVTLVDLKTANCILNSHH